MYPPTIYSNNPHALSGPIKPEKGLCCPAYAFRVPKRTQCCILTAAFTLGFSFQVNNLV